MKYSQILQHARDLRKNQTKAEKLFWKRVRNRGLLRLKFNRQFIIEHQNSSYFIADFYCHQHKLIIELDGKIHLSQVEYDKIRESILRDLGYTIIRFTNEEVIKKWKYVRDEIEHITTNK